MAVTQTQIDALEAALASGELRVSYDGRTVEYRSIKELREALAYCRTQIESAAGTFRRKRHHTDAPRQGGWSR